LIFLTHKKNKDKKKYLLSPEFTVSIGDRTSYDITQRNFPPGSESFSGGYNQVEL
jgi:hypothetical protein